MSKATAALLPREHGTWAMLLAPWAIACGVADRLSWEEVLFLGAALAAFLAYAQVMQHARLGLPGRPDPAMRARTRVRAALLVALAAGATLPLVALRGRTALVVFAVLGGVPVAAGLRLVHARRERALAGQVLAAVGLPLTAPATYYVARGMVDGTAVALWGLCVLFFLGAVLYVRLKIQARARRAALASPVERLRLAGTTVAVDAAIALGVLGLLRLGGLSPLAGLAFVPVAVQTVAGVARLDRPVSLKRLGIVATAHTVVFSVLLIGLARG